MTEEEYIKSNWGEAWLINQWKPGDVIDALKEYAEQRIREELIKYTKWYFRTISNEYKFPNEQVNEYLKQRQK